MMNLEIEYVNIYGITSVVRMIDLTTLLSDSRFFQKLLLYFLISKLKIVKFRFHSSCGKILAISLLSSKRYRSNDIIRNEPDFS